MCGVDNRNLVVVAGFVVKVRQREQIQQSACLWTDSVWRNDVSRNRRSRSWIWIDQLHRLAKRIDTLRKIAAPLRCGRHPPCQRVGISILRSLVAEEKCRSVVSEQVWNPEGAADIERTGKFVVSRLCRVLSG